MRYVRTTGVEGPASRRNNLGHIVLQFILWVPAYCVSKTPCIVSKQFSTPNFLLLSGAKRMLSMNLKSGRQSLALQSCMKHRAGEEGLRFLVTYFARRVH